MSNETIIIFFQQKAKVICDQNCKKAWGSSSRPYKKISDDTDDIMWYGDNQLRDAPEDPKTYEGLEMQGKPLSPNEFPTKWCVRECERCVMSNPGEYNKALNLKDWSKNRYNISQKEALK